MQFRFTLSDEDAVEGRILREIKPLNVRRRSEYFRRILAKGFMAELAERDLLARVPEPGLSRDEYMGRDYNERSMRRDSSGQARSDRLSAGSLVGIFQDQSAAATADDRAAVTGGGEQ